jgi:MFS family permease
MRAAIIRIPLPALPFQLHRLVIVSTEVSAASTTPAFSRATVVTVVALTTLAQIGAVMGIAVFPVIAPKLAAEMGVEPSLIGYQMSLIYGAAMLSSPFLTWMVTRFGACRAIQTGLLLSLTALVLALWSGLAALIAASILLGAAMSVMTPAGAHVLFRFSPPKRRNLVFSIKQTCVPAGWMIMALVAPPVTLLFGWKWAIALVMIFAVAMIIALQCVRAAWDDDRKPQAGNAAQQAREGMMLLWKMPELRWLSVASMFMSGVQLCLSSFAVTMLVQEAGYGLIEAGVMLSVAQGAGVVGRIAWGWIADRYGNCLGLLLKLSAVMVVCCAVMGFVTPQWSSAGMALLFLVFGASAVGWNGLFLAEVARLSPPGKVSVATSGAMVWNFAGILIGPALFAMTVRVNSSYALTYGWLSLFAVGGTAALVMTVMHARRAAAAG